LKHLNTNPKKSEEKMPEVRPPSHAGTFYKGSAEALTRQIEECFLHKFGPGNLPRVNLLGQRKIVSVVTPHAGYLYSGPIAANAYYELALDGRPEIFVIIGPNHTGLGSAVSIMLEGVWRTPLGDALIDKQVSDDIQNSSKYIDIDESAHRYEHSIEVQLPFLQYIYGKNIRFVPISMMMQDLEVSRDVGCAISEATSNLNSVIVSSTDLTHYQPQKVAIKNDNLVIDAILELDEARLQQVVDKNNISMCGLGPTATAVTVAKELGAKKTKLLSYKTSGDITGMQSRVVGYAAIVIEK
jgi:AmmeMemoRadiSam system protein B